MFGQLPGTNLNAVQRLVPLATLIEAQGSAQLLAQQRLHLDQVMPGSCRRAVQFRALALIKYREEQLEVVAADLRRGFSAGEPKLAPVIA